MTATAAIFHHPDAMESANTPLAGRRAAGQSFLAGYVRHAQTDKLRCVAGSDAHIEHFRQAVTAFGWRGEIEGTLLRNPQDIAQHGALMLPGPSLGPYAWTRRRASELAYSMVGITHTVSTRRICSSLYDLISAPVRDWDAIICTSKAVHSVVAEIIEESAHYMAERFGARQVPLPQLPIIPLGINTDRFSHDDAERAEWRSKMNISEDEVVLMSMGRLTVFEKMHPAPLMSALQRVTEETGVKLVFLMAGWFGDTVQERLHRDAARDLAPDVRVEFPDGKDPDLRYSLWSAADIFTLPVDNIQETFGLVPVEAMATGLPVVCSDWDGFKDTVVDGETGIRVRSLMARAGHGRAIAQRFEDQQDTYLQYLGVVQQRTAIDVREMADAFTALIQAPEKRKAMGEAGRERAQQMYDWAAVIPQYQALWADLAARRARTQPTTPREKNEPAHPASIDPFQLYRGYPTDVLTGPALLSAERGLSVDDVKTAMQHTGAIDLRRMVAPAEAVAAIQNIVHAEGPIRSDALLGRGGGSETQTEAIVLWLLKFDMIQLAAAGDEP